MVSQEKADATDWSETIEKLASLKDETLLVQFGTNITLLVLARVAGSDKKAAKGLIPMLEKMHTLMCEEIHRRGLKHEGLLI
jgi:hypothetical protein